MDTAEILNLGDNFEALLKARLQSHQTQLDNHRVNIYQKIEWLNPSQTRHVDPMAANATPYRQFQRAQMHKPNTETTSDTPVRISDKTKKLAAKRRVDLGVNNLPIEESLAIRAEQSKAMKWLAAQSLAEKEVPGKPMITERASALPSSTISQTTARLFQSGPSNEKVLLALKTQLQTLVDENMEATFKPTITRYAEQLARRPDHTAHDDLYAQARAQQEYRARMEQGNERLRSQQMRHRSPTVNRMSALIAERLPETTADRIMRPKRHDTANMNTTPSRRSYSTSRTNALYNDHSMRQARLMVLASEKSKLPEECTFTPQIYSASNTRALPLADRFQSWEQRRQHRIENKRDELSRGELSECTFTPTINGNQKFVDVQWEHPGIQEHVSRQLSARRQIESPEKPARPPRQESVDAEVLQKAIEALERARTSSKKLAAK